LVLQAAVTTAAQGQRVLVILGEERLAKLPTSWHQIPSAEPEIMVRVSFHYPSNCQELVKFTSDASSDTLPDTLIVADK
jgi:hypothetical protein